MQQKCSYKFVAGILNRPLTRRYTKSSFSVVILFENAFPITMLPIRSPAEEWLSEKTF